MRSTADTYADMVGRGRSAEQIRSVALARGDLGLQKMAEDEMAKKQTEKNSKKRVPSAVESGEQITMVPLVSIAPSPLNRHLVEDDQGILQLADSMRTEGLIQPIVLREGEDLGDGYEIVCGQRRWLAAKNLGWTEIPAIIRDIGQQAAHAQRLIENLQRLDIAPMEQSEGVAALLEMHGDDHQEVAKRLGVSLAWVYLRERLRNLSPLWRAALAGPETDYPEIADRVSLQEQIARLPQETQDDLLAQKALLNQTTAQAVRDAIGEHLRIIDERPWKEDEKGCPGLKRCSRCDNRSDREASLFADIQVNPKKDARCLVPSCWQKTLDQWLKIRISAARSLHKDLVLLTNHWGYNRRETDHLVGLKVAVRHYWRDEEQGADDDEERWKSAHGIFIDGPRIGQTIECLVDASLFEDEEGEEEPANQAAEDAEENASENQADNPYPARARLQRMVDEKWPCPALALDEDDIGNGIQLSSEVVTASAILSIIGNPGVALDQDDGSRSTLKKWLDATMNDASLVELAKSLTESIRKSICSYGLDHLEAEDIATLAEFMGYDWYDAEEPKLSRVGGSKE